ncbi:hypothetical protein LQF61_05945 [Tetragenococcus koreensis]|nr:hypothetical protein [Tetragenococcus koreensis]MCF1585256.1 hypothetical protein [Tetragenococcus koreensis]MCF1614233.1 hypothetical protein [Tetragenococcus koreensis]MCF1619622.1 hypothetical protein [Tetragenococcus koreensis]MCF1624014.1 hypothetical protein [Tetragenococcus koreensis]MCF1629545.1 hypothetical protein [Tetragenococcus koreensis]
MNANVRSSYLWFYQGLVEKEIEERMNEMFSILDLSGIELGNYYLSFRTLAINWQHIKRCSTSFVMILIYLK